MRDIKYVIFKDGKHYVAQCLNVEVASFGDTIDEAVANISEAVELYCEDDSAKFMSIDMAILGEKRINI